MAVAENHAEASTVVAGRAVVAASSRVVASGTVDRRGARRVSKTEGPALVFRDLELLHMMSSVTS